MPYVVDTGGVVAVTLEGRMDGQQIMTVTHWKMTAVAPSPDGRLTLNALLNRLVDGGAYAEAWRACMSVRVSQLTIKAQWVSPTRFAFVQRSLAIDSGVVAGQSEPVNCAVSITRRTDNAGRRERGTIHMPGVPNTFLTNSTVNGLGLAAYDAFGVKAVLELLAVQPGISFAPVPFHRINPILVNNYTNFQTQPFSRVQRRRTVGLGA